MCGLWIYVRGPQDRLILLLMCEEGEVRYIHRHIYIYIAYYLP